jgi:hypothetical protein
MYDSDPEALAAQRAAAARPTQPQAHQPPPPDIPGHLSVEAIAACDLCDPDGYRSNGKVCDHVDRTETARAGAEACREALKSKGKQ